jgi:hypothetical protein
MATYKAAAKIRGRTRVSTRWVSRGFAVAVVLVFVTYLGSSPLAAAATPASPSCITPVPGINTSGTVSMPLCPTVGANPLISGPPYYLYGFYSPWNSIPINQTACNTQVSPINGHSYDPNNVNYFYSYQYVRADASSSCSTNTAEIEDNVGVHDWISTNNYLQAWKSSGSTYTVTAWISVNFFESAGTYCLNNGATVEGWAAMQLNDAMWDNSLGIGVGASALTTFTSQDGNNPVIETNCNAANNPNGYGSTIQVTFTTSTAIQQYDNLIPRASMWPESIAEAPWCPNYGAAHAYAIQDTSQSSSVYVELETIEVS